jgi:hypothetical protein
MEVRVGANVVAVKFFHSFYFFCRKKKKRKKEKPQVKNI